ncbi:MAG: STAS/SEC14 domain-containing protein [Candidatus Pacearchaeota archaeon]|nr:STAS/SEC14 domain-containing protein [Candidatus Pacearchaeota archaeon]
MIEHNIQVDHDLQIIFVVVSGIITEDDYKGVSGKVWALSTELSYHAFYDLVDTRFTFTVDVSARLPREISEKSSPNAKNSRVALLVNPRDYSKWKFIEMINHGMGFKTRPFMNKEDAMAWLFS